MVTQRGHGADLYGLVLAGGQSARMGVDKSLLAYRGIPHRFYIAHVLGDWCARVFISVNAGQAQLEPERYAYLVDREPYAGNGPIGALLGAIQAQPGAAWFVVSCDLPFFDAACASHLCAHRARDEDATAFLNAEVSRPEPLITIYEPRFLDRLPAAFADGQRSLMRLLHAGGHSRVLRDYDRRWVFSADTPEAHAAAVRVIASGRADR